MKINLAFFLINHNSVGGVERVTLNLINEFKKRNIDTKTIFSLGDTSVRNQIIPFPKQIEFIGLSKEEFILNLNKQLIEKNISHIIFQGDNMTISKNILEASKDTNCKAILHYHGSPYAYLKKHLYWHDIKENPINLIKIGISKIMYPFKKAKLLKNIKNSTSGFVVVSNGIKNELETIYNEKFDNIICIHNPTSFIPIEEEFNLPKEKTVILISRLVRKHKNVLLALRAWKHIYKAHPEWKFEILGDGLLLPKIKKFIKHHNLKNITLKGHITNIDYYLKRSAISISTSDTEGFSMTTYEAMIFKNPIVLTKSYGGISDLVVHNENGLFSPRGNDKKLAKNIERLINDEKLRTKMGNNSYQKFLDLQKEDIFLKWKNLL